MRIVMTNQDNMNSNSRQDPSNLNTNFLMSRHGGAADEGMEHQQEATGSKSSGGDQSSSGMSNFEYLKNLANVMVNQGGDGGGNINNSNHSSSNAGTSNHGFSSGNDNFQGPSSNSAMAAGGNNNDFLNIQQNNGSDTDTCASSQYNMRRVSKDSLVSRDSLSDMLGGGADQVTSNNLAMMNMLANQQQQMGGGGNQNMSFGNNFTTDANNNPKQNNQALNQSMSQLMMNGSMGMNSMTGQLNATAAAASMMNNSMGTGGWNNNANSNPMSMTDPSLLGAYGLDSGGMSGSNSTAPLLIPPKKTKNKHKQTFAQKLMHILSIKECQASIRWMPNGCAFCIVDSKELVEKVLPKYFKEAKYTSFTRKLNRWGFKHFTLPTSEPSQDKEMSIYTHEKFLRDNPDLCQQMDGGHRRRSSKLNESDDTTSSLGLGAAGASVGQGNNNVLQGGSNTMSQLQQSNMMIQQMQQMQQQSMMMQQMQQQLNQNQGNQGPMFDMSALNNMGQGGTEGTNNFNSMMGSTAFNNNSNVGMGNNQGSNMNSFMDSNNSNFMGMRRTSLGFMPYLPASNRRDSGFSTGGVMNRRDSGFSTGGLSTVSNDLASSFTAGGNNTGNAAALAGLGSALSLEKFRKMSPTPTAMGGGGGNNATFDDFKVSGGSMFNQGSQLGEGKTAEQDGDSKTDEDIRHSQAKLAVLEDMIAKERRKQSLLSSLDPDPVTM